MFEGFLDEAVAGTLLLQILADDGSPVEPDAAPSFRVYGQNGLVTGGTGAASSFETGSITGATNAAPIVLTSAAHGVSTGQAVTVASVGGNTAANGNFRATNVSSTTFSLQGSTGNGSYTSGGTWRTTGLYKVVLSGSVLAALEAGKTYTVIVTYAVSGDIKTQILFFTVR